jgi:hypothetical protein
LQNGDTLTLIVSGREVIGLMHETKKKGDPVEEGLHKRFGRPDRVTGSGRGFLHYDLQNGDTLTLIVSGREVIGLMHERKKK